MWLSIQYLKEPFNMLFQDSFIVVFNLLFDIQIKKAV
jgi:hypothetical protein